MKIGVRTRGRLSQIAIAVVALLAHSDVSIGGSICRPPEVSQEEVQRKCEKAFTVLRNTMTTDEGTNNSEEHFIKYREKYNEFDSKCLCKFSQAKDYTREFLSKYLVAIFAAESVGNDPQPYCTGFRVSQNIVVTAKHCATELGVRSLRFLSHPGIAYEFSIDDIVKMKASGGDLSDYSLIKVRGKLPNFLGSPDGLSSEVEVRQALNVFAISRPAYFLNDTKPSHWVEAVRYSKVNSAQAFDPSKIAQMPTDASASSRCLYYGIETFAGMSGAPVLKINRVVGNGNPTIKIVGIHLRDAATSGECGRDERFNVGIRLPEELIIAAKHGGTE